MDANVVMVTSHDHSLVALSVMISILAAYAAREFAERVGNARGRVWLTWLVGGALVDGIGTWSTHYTGELALRWPVPVLFDWPTVLLSLAVSVAGSGAALLVMSRGEVGWLRAVVAGIFLGGVGISGLHYTSMAAMRLPGGRHYAAATVALSVALAVLISVLALAPAFLFRGDAPRRRWRSHGGALLRGSANPVMHYTAMAAVAFTYPGEAPDLSHAVDLLSLGIPGISLVPALVIIVAVLAALVDRLRGQRAQLDELFEQAPQAVALMSADYRVVRVNREFTRLFGYDSEEIVGRDLGELIVPDESRGEAQTNIDTLARGQRVEAEGVRQRKDGSRLYVSIVHVPASLPGGRIARYAVYRDITERRRAEVSLKLFRTLIDQSSDAIEVIDPNTLRFIDCNESANRCLGYSREEFLSLSVWDIDPTLDQESFARSNEEIEKSGSATFETLHRRKDGSIFPVEVNVQVVWLEREYRLAVVRDITERKRAEGALRRAEEKYRSIFENAVEGIFQTTPDGRFITANPALARMLGYDSPDQLLGGRTDIARQQYVDPGRRAEFKRRLEEHGVVREFEHEAYRKDGSKIWLSENVRAVCDEGGAVLYYEGFSEDITERKLADERLKQSESRLAEAQHLSRLGSWNWDLRSNTLTWSDEVYRIFGVDPLVFGPSYDDTFMDFIRADDRALVRGVVEDSLQTREPFSFHYRVLRPDGEERVIHSRGQIACDEHGHPVRMFGTAQDVTERRRTEERLRATTAQLRALSARLNSVKEEEGTRIAREIHDELGAALTSLRWDLASVDKIIAGAGDRPQLRRARERIGAMLGLTETTIGAIRRISAELRPGMLDDLGLVAAIDWQAGQFQARTGITCRCVCSTENLNLGRERSTAVFRIFQEALTNILRHARATTVDITAKAEAGEFVLTIVDNGRGITEDERTGARSLGLLGMRERAQLIGGKIDIDGVAGAGTVITIQVPLSADDNSEAARASVSVLSPH